ncbi:MAG TPA: SpoIIE family protein phosphatase [Balneolaceae bacterium]
MNLTIREYSFFALSLLAGLYFFIAYPAQDPRSIVDLRVDATSIEQKAISQLETLGYSTPQFNIETAFRANNELLDSLQASMGRPEMIDYFKQQDVANIKPYYWEITFRKKTDDANEMTVSSSSSDEDPANSDIQAIKMRFSTDGEFLALINSDNVLPLKSVNRAAMGAAFSVPQDSAVAVLAEFGDSTLANQLFINIQQSYGQLGGNQKERIQRLEILLRQGRHFMLSGQDMLKMASWYLEKTGWTPSELKADTVFMGRTNGENFASVRFKLTEPKLGQKLSLSVRILPTGALLGLSAVYNTNGDNAPSLWPFIRNAIIFLFFIAAVILFFFRIRAGAVDTKPALVVAIVGGIAFSLQFMLMTLSGTAFENLEGGMKITLILILAGMAGAAICLLFFVFFAIGDSITRQHWGQKLSTYDYLRQGMIFNQPVGSMVIRSVMLGFILAGLWTLLLSLFPGLYIDIEEVFSHESSLWPPLYLFLSILVTSLGIVLGIFLVLGGQTFAQTKNKIAASGVMVLSCIIMVPVIGSYGPLLNELLISALLGVGLTLIYLKWDFMTLLLSHFLFLGLLATASGWMIEGSMDTYIFGSFLLLVIFFIVSGVLAVVRGEKEQGLSRFVPEYVEELAQEERIKQELQIAREVQQSFLPERTPEFPRLQLSAICKPAYETGGDYYDFIPLDENRIAVTIGDVSGKGIQAAFYMTFVKGIIHSLCRETKSPAELLKKANRLFYDNAPRGTFISLVYGVIDLEKHCFHFARAGHNPVLKINGQSDSVEELQPKGIGIGLAKDASFDCNIEEIELNICMDDVLVLYTDGIVEALNENHVFYGTYRLNNLLKKNKEGTTEVILNEVTNDVQTYIGNAKQHDDMTMIVIKLKGEKIRNKEV